MTSFTSAEKGPTTPWPCSKYNTKSNPIFFLFPFKVDGKIKNFLGVWRAEVICLISCASSFAFGTFFSKVSFPLILRLYCTAYKVFIY